VGQQQHHQAGIQTTPMPRTIQAALAQDGPTIPWDRYGEELAWQSEVAGDNATNGKAKQFFEEVAGVGGYKVFG